MAHDTKRKAHDVPTTYTRRAPDTVVASGLSFPLALLGVDALPAPVLVVPLAANNREIK